MILHCPNCGRAYRGAGDQLMCDDCDGVILVEEKRRNAQRAVRSALDYERRRDLEDRRVLWGAAVGTVLMLVASAVVGFGEPLSLVGLPVAGAAVAWAPVRVNDASIVQRMGAYVAFVIGAAGFGVWAFAYGQLAMIRFATVEVVFERSESVEQAVAPFVGDLNACLDSQDGAGNHELRLAWLDDRTEVQTSYGVAVDLCIERHAERWPVEAGFTCMFRAVGNAKITGPPVVVPERAATGSSKGNGYRCIITP